MFLKVASFLFISYNVKFSFLHGLGTAYIVLSFFLLYSLLSGKLKSLQTIPMCICAFLVLYSTVIYLLNLPHSDIGFFKYITFSFLSLLVSGTIFNKFFRNEPIDFFKVFGLVGIVNALFIIVMLLSPLFQQFYLKFIIVEAKSLFGQDIIDGFFSLRMVGVTGFSSYSSGFTQCFCLFSYYIYASYENNGKLKWRDYCIMFIIIVSALIAARSSIVGIFIVYLLMFFDSRNARNNLIFFFMSVLFSLIFLTLSSYLLSAEKFDFFSNWVTALFQHGSDVGSLQTMEKMFKFSFDDFPLLGESRINDSNGKYFMGVDIGYFRLLFSSGYIGTVAVILMYISFFSSTGLSNKLNLKCYFFVYAMLFIFMIKGLIIFDAFYLTFYISLMTYALNALNSDIKLQTK